jgi:hypothetical protein
MTDAEVERIKAAPDTAGWSDAEQAILRAADALHARQFIGARLWDELGGMLSEEERIDLILVIGHYTQVCMFLNTVGVQVEADKTLDRDLIDLAD